MQLVSYPRRVIGLGEEWDGSVHSHSSHYGHSPIQRNFTSSPGSAIITTQTSHHQRLPCPNRSLGPCSVVHCPSSSPYLPALRPSIAHPFSNQFSFADTRYYSPTTLSHESTIDTGTIGAPISSLSKLFMHRHVRIAFYRSPTYLIYYSAVLPLLDIIK